MKLTMTLSRYIAKNYVWNVLFLLLGLLALILLFDTVELIRRASKQEGVPFSMVIQMALFKLPEVGQLLIPFAILLASIFTFWQLTRRHELVVVRAAGFSVWQFLMPVMGVAVILGLFQVMVINPMGAVFLGKFSQLERTYLERGGSQVKFLRGGLWLRQDDQQGDGYMIIHAAKVKQPGWTFQDVSVLQFSGEDEFINRYDARRASLDRGNWVLGDVLINRTGQAPEKNDSVIFATTLTTEEIEDSFAAPETMSFWSLPSYIHTLEETGFDATRLRVHYQSLLAQPLFLAAMVLLAASVSMRPPRFRGTFALIVTGVFIGFVVFFMSSFLQALGTSHQIPVFLAAWSPALVCFLLGLTVIMNTEDG